MIVPMKKVSLITLGDKKTDTLKKLRKLGLLHIEISEGSGERLNELKNQISLLLTFLFFLLFCMQYLNGYKSFVHD